MTFTGEKQIRGIPAKQWGTCIYEPTLKKTTAFLVAFSDESKWTPAHITPDKKSVPIEIKIASKDANTGNIEYIENYITRYKQETLLDEDLIYTGPGVYCPNRAISSQKPFPDITKKFPFFSTWIQNTAPASAINYVEGAFRSYKVNST